MNDERPQDEIVSAAYRELAGERAPEHLDEKVLAMAKDKADRPRYSRSIMWTRPLAWAATIALTLAITLEITRVPTPEVQSPRPALPAEPQASPQAEAALEAEALPETQELRRAKSIPESISPEKTALGRSVAKQVADEPARDNRKREAAGSLEGDATKEAMPAAAMDFELKDADMRQRADELMQLEEGLINKPDDEGFAAFSSAVTVAPNECSDEARAQPESWLECIDALEAAGDKDAAARQRENLEEKFPDFKLP